MTTFIRWRVISSLSDCIVFLRSERWSVRRGIGRLGVSRENENGKKWPNFKPSILTNYRSKFKLTFTIFKPLSVYFHLIIGLMSFLYWSSTDRAITFVGWKTLFLNGRIFANIGIYI